MATRTISAVGGNWNSTATWVEGAVPTSADDVVATALSGNVTITATAFCRSINLTGYTGTLTHNAGVTLSVGDATAGAGSVALKFPAAMTYALTGAPTPINFVSTSATQQTIDYGGKSVGAVTFNGTGGSWRYLSAHTAAAALSVLAGSLDINGQTCSISALISNGLLTRSLTLGAASLTMSASGNAWVTSTSGITLSAALSTLTFTGSATFTAGNGQVFGTVNFNGSGAATLSGAVTFASLTRTGTASKSDNMSLGADITVTGTLTVTGNSLTNRILLFSSLPGFARTVTAGAVSLTNIDIADISAAGATPFAGTSLADVGGNSGITFPASVTRYAVVAGNWSSTATWSTTSGGAGGASVPLAHDNVVLDASSGAGTYTADMPRMGANVACTGFTRTLAFTSLGVLVRGSLTLAAGMTVNATQTIIFGGRGTHTITPAGKTLSAVTFNAPGAVYTLAGVLVCTGILTLNYGTFDLAGFTVTALRFLSTGAGARTLDIEGATVNLTETTTTVFWSVDSSGLTLLATGSTIALTIASANNRTFAGGGLTYNALTYTVAGSTGSLIVQGSNTFATINFSDATNARTLTLTVGTTTTVTSWGVVGAAGRLVTLQSSVAGSPATLAKAGGGTITADFLSIRDSAATPGATWFATNSTNVSGNTGWTFGLPPSPKPPGSVGIRSRADAPHRAAVM